ncbi:MAG: hypothetical protein Q7T00_01940 [Rugosibacter sp.]|nr:hypothetical protein [Rugosibacter sp.]MDO9271684.1 hypothetical protein [Rugosibacter sp.]
MRNSLLEKSAVATRRGQVIPINLVVPKLPQPWQDDDIGELLANDNTSPSR